MWSVSGHPGGPQSCPAGGGLGPSGAPAGGPGAGRSRKPWVQGRKGASGRSVCAPKVPRALLGRGPEPAPGGGSRPLAHAAPLAPARSAPLRLTGLQLGAAPRGQGAAVCPGGSARSAGPLSPAPAAPRQPRGPRERAPPRITDETAPLSRGRPVGRGALGILGMWEVAGRPGRGRRVTGSGQGGHTGLQRGLRCVHAAAPSALVPSSWRRVWEEQRVGPAGPPLWAPQNPGATSGLVRLCDWCPCGSLALEKRVPEPTSQQPPGGLREFV